jgi:ADP-ribose pyrophosphatase YjhB (NUDIX family)
MRFLRLGVECAVFDDDGRVLLSRRGDLNVWNLPGGRLDNGERLEEAVVREVREETGVIIQVEKAIGLNFLADWGRLNVIYTGWPLGGQLQKRTAETRANQYFAPDSLPRMPWRTALDDVLAGSRPSPRIIASASSEVRRVRMQLRWRWVKNLLRGRPEPRFPRFHVTAVGLVWNRDHLRVMTYLGRDGHILPSVVCDGETAPWSQLAIEIRDRTSVEADFQWVGLWEDTPRNRIELIFAATVEETEFIDQCDWSVPRNIALSSHDMSYVERVKPTYRQDPVWTINHDDHLALGETLLSVKRAGR